MKVEERLRKKRAENGTRGQKTMTFRVDNENAEWLEKQPNKGRAVNDAIEAVRKGSRHQETRYNVYLCNAVEATRVKGFDDLAEAAQYVAEETREKQAVNAADTDNGNNWYQLEVYDGHPVEAGNEHRVPIITTRRYYY